MIGLAQNTDLNHFYATVYHPFFSKYYTNEILLHCKLSVWYIRCSFFVLLQGTNSSILHWAAHNDKLDIVQLLVNNGADCTLRDKVHK